MTRRKIQVFPTGVRKRHREKCTYSFAVIASMDKNRPGSQDNLLWISVIATLTLCLWFSNLLPIQRIEHELVTNVAVSQHRLPLLQNLLRRDVPSSQETVPIFQVIAITPLEYEVNSNFRSEMVSVRLTLRFPKRPSIKEVEGILNKLTEPQEQDASCVKLANELRNERWLLESNRHSTRRLELDIERDRKAVSNTGDEDSQQARAPMEGPFKLASFSFHQKPSDPTAELRKELEQRAAGHLAKIEQMTLALDRLREKSKGFLSFTGSPQLSPIAHAVSPSRYLVLVAVCFACWGVIIGWIIPSRRIRSLFRFRETERKSLDRNSEMACLREIGIPFLGEIRISISESEFRADHSSVVELLASANSPTNVVTNTWWPRITAHGIRLQSECLLLVWGLLFLLRYTMDTTWRELVTLAPLAAISRLIFGIQ